MNLKQTIYEQVPESAKPYVKRGYHKILGTSDFVEKQLTPEDFKTRFFDSEAEYKRYLAEFDEGRAKEIRAQAENRYFKLFDYSFGAVDFEIGKHYYALVRAQAPDRIVETGVCNGFSTLAILLALEANDHGKLVSIDFPRRADESVEDHLLGEYGQDAMDDRRIWKAPAIPQGEEPGWIIPESCRNRWELKLGKSQRELPREVAENGEFDMFFHDSEHTTTCMLFEYDLAYNWLCDGGIIVSDDTHLNDAFEIFEEDRAPPSGKLREDVGYIVKPTD